MKIKSALLQRLAVIMFISSAVSSYSQDKSSFTEPRDERRNRIQPPEKIMDTIGLKPGMAIGDIGAGRGRFAVWFADRVGESGKVFANDINSNSLEYLKKRCDRHGFKNVKTVPGKVDDPCLPKSQLDIAFMIGTYHHLEKPVELMRNVIPALKPDGILVIVEYDPEKPGVDFGNSSTPREKLVRQLNRAGYEIIKIETFLEQDNIYISRPKNRGK